MRALTMILLAACACRDDMPPPSSVNPVSGNAGQASGAGAAAGDSGNGGAAGVLAPPAAAAMAPAGSGGERRPAGAGGAGESGMDGGAAGAQAGSGGAPEIGGTGGAAGRPDHTMTNGFPSVRDFDAPGPFEVTSEPGGSGCTIYRPTTLGENGLKHPVIIWGNGTFTTVSIYDAGLTHFASHGFIVTAPNGNFLGSGAEMLGCLEWVLDQNESSGPYQGHVAVDRVGATGHSQGAGGAVMTAADPRVKTAAPMATWTGLSSSSAYAMIEGPMFIQNCENDSTASPPMAQPIFDALDVVFWGTVIGATHTEAVGDHGAHKAPTTAWFRWQLMDDQEASKMFVGPDCGLCGMSSGWTNIQKKGID